MNRKILGHGSTRQDIGRPWLRYHITTRGPTEAHRLGEPDKTYLGVTTAIVDLGQTGGQMETEMTEGKEEDQVRLGKSWEGLVVGTGVEQTGSRAGIQGKSSTVAWTVLVFYGRWILYVSAEWGYAGG
ncbi:hypothetical protein DPEC_G00259290 [Dallia pectoralis]|uniref:Uncharacterized protein n=1 Tax=Dallia pectoralis TaxID=75939 RepID=A0ACC2FRA8_DALPE|nr:hypothetical protein DPEC_G00259290 [Dallia pectoralis]